MFGLVDSAGPPAWVVFGILFVCAIIIIVMVHLQHEAEIKAMEESFKDYSKITPSFEEEVDHALNTSGHKGDTRQ